MFLSLFILDNRARRYANEIEQQDMLLWQRSSGINQILTCHLTLMCVIPMVTAVLTPVLGDRPLGSEWDNDNEGGGDGSSRSPLWKKKKKNLLCFLWSFAAALFIQGAFILEIYSICNKKKKKWNKKMGDITLKEKKNKTLDRRQHTLPRSGC